MTKHDLIIQAKKSRAVLTAQGFELVATSLAGSDSKFVYQHDDGRKAVIAVKNGNKIEYKNQENEK